jgi:hypothetical protein
MEVKTWLDSESIIEDPNLQTRLTYRLLRCLKP